MMEENLNNMSRSELYDKAKEVAKENNLMIPFGNKTNAELIRMISTGEGFISKKEARDNKKRTPLGALRTKMSVSGYDLKPNEKDRWVNDWPPGRLQAAQEGGYRFIEDPDATVGEDSMRGRDGLGSKISRPVGLNGDGQPMKSYYMVIDRDLYDEDQAEKQRHVDETDKAIQGGNVDGKFSDNRYDAGIKIESNMKT